MHDREIKIFLPSKGETSKGLDGRRVECQQNLEFILCGFDMLTKYNWCLGHPSERVEVGSGFRLLSFCLFVFLSFCLFVEISRHCSMNLYIRIPVLMVSNEVESSCDVSLARLVGCPKT